DCPPRVGPSDGPVRRRRRRSTGGSTARAGGIVLPTEGVRRGRGDPCFRVDIADPTGPRGPGALSRQLGRIRPWRTKRGLLDRALPLAEPVGGAVLVHVLLGLIWLGCETGELDQTHAILERALELAEQLGDPAEV